MKLRGKWGRGGWRSEFPAPADRETAFEAATASGLDHLQTRLNQWSDLWGQETDPAVRSEAQRLVAERLTRWMERCLGQHVENSLRTADGPISLATSTPIFTAFLGRRATRELSRRVLQDI